jgi:hypothetical protein
VFILFYFLIFFNLVMWPKWWSSIRRFSQIWLETRYECEIT